MILFLLGLVSGIVSGMGIGGGTILIPALVLFAKPDQHIAQSVNLIFFIPTAVVALVIHIKNRRIDFKTAIPIAVFGLLGAFIGSRFAIKLPGSVLKKYFGVFLLILGIYEMIRKDEKRPARNNN
ncbi:sulfite exporter TauE/SafE family protein [Acetivibrio clariflavus]|uniref:Probable membrane transporter protein n=1 Tax=Acetivibrio clariflavus (strain DSM 19732 / NBRC 101661 / EBR45) TaxID=720554 RepID=G8LUC3_ACECE|nr:sulfite exporter TauE/SafE family protein [Acetivibrio clariflavus]AEV69555.1 putative permease [Acetivibrio clariflavus DSM 19732]